MTLKFEIEYHMNHGVSFTTDCCIVQIDSEICILASITSDSMNRVSEKAFKFNVWTNLNAGQKTDQIIKNIENFVMKYDCTLTDRGRKMIKKHYRKVKHAQI